MLVWFSSRLDIGFAYVCERPDRAAKAAMVGCLMMRGIRLGNRVRVMYDHIVRSDPTTSSYIPNFPHRVTSSSS